MTTTQPVLHCLDLNKNYHEGELTTPVLKNIDFSLGKGEQAVIVGRSGSGKTTLLNMLAGLDLPDSGEVHLCGHVLSKLNDNQRARVRNQHLGFVYQFHHLLPEFSALENVMMPLLIAKQGHSKAREEAYILLEKIGLKERVNHRPAKLSGGERQRVAIARALVNKPDVILADEPTGNLDSYNAQRVRELILQLNQEFGLSFLLVSHDETMTASFKQVYRMEDGKLHREK